MAAAIGFYVLTLHNKINSLTVENAKLQAAVSEKQSYMMAQSILIEANRAEYAKRLVEFPAVIHEVEKKYYPVTQEIIKWRDQNVSHDCNESMQFINNFAF